MLLLLLLKGFIMCVHSISYFPVAATLKEDMGSSATELRVSVASLVSSSSSSSYSEKLESRSEEELLFRELLYLSLSLLSERTSKARSMVPFSVSLGLGLSEEDV